jgi:hypothetical protein
MKPGDVYNLRGKTYMIIELLERSWSFMSDDGEEQMRSAVPHISCVGPKGFEEFPLDWFCHGAEAINEDSP